MAKPIEGVAIERSDDLAADALRYDEDASGNHVAVAVSPDLNLKDDAALEVFEGGEGLNAEGGVRAFVHGLGGSLTAFFA